MIELKSILLNALVMCLTATVILLCYSYRSNGRDFNLLCWFRTNVNRFYVGGIIIIALCVLIGVSEDVSAIIRLLGFSADQSPIGLGIAIATFLIAGVSGNPADKGVTSETKTNSN